MTKVKLLSWNVNGVRAAVKKVLLLILIKLLRTLFVFRRSKLSQNKYPKINGMARV